MSILNLTSEELVKYVEKNSKKSKIVTSRMVTMRIIKKLLQHTWPR